MKGIIPCFHELQHFLDLCYLAIGANDVDAQAALARHFWENGQNDPAKIVFEGLEKLARQGYTPMRTDAQFLLAKCYEKGYGVGKSDTAAIRWYNAAGDNILFDLPIYRRRDGGKIEEILDQMERGEITPEQLKNLTEAAERGDQDMQKCLLYAYWPLTGPFEWDEEKWVYWVNRLAENGDAEAMEGLGDTYYYGRVGKRNVEKALVWLEKAANQGKWYSAHLLGSHYRSRKRVDLALKWYRTYAELRIKLRNDEIRNSIKR